MNTSSPYNSSTITHGQLDPIHTTDASLVYSPQSLLTPWPYLLCSIGLSLALSLWAYIKARRTFAALARIYVPTKCELKQWKGQEIRHDVDIVQKYEHQIARPLNDSHVYLANGNVTSDPRGLPPFPRNGWVNTTGDSATVGISLLRAGTLLVSSIRALTGNGGRFRSCMAIFIAVAPMLVFIIDNERGAMVRLMEVGYITMLVALQIMIWPRLTTNSDFYGQWFLQGGNCAFAVKACPGNFSTVGCGLNTTNATGSNLTAVPPYNFDKIGSPNYVSDAEPIMGQILNVGGLTMLAAIYGICRALCQYLRKGRKPAARRIEIASTVQEWKGEMRRRYLDATDQLHGVFYRLAIIVSLGIICAVIHVCQEMQPKSMWIVDSVGPLVANGTALTSWSDCFRVAPVHDQYGFFHFWWNEVKLRPVEWLSVI
jgi:hypothetical protein